jgi:hypothetical protein
MSEGHITKWQELRANDVLESCMLSDTLQWLHSNNTRTYQKMQMEITLILIHLSLALIAMLHVASQIGNELLKVKGEGTLEWPIEDDLGRIHKIQIKNALYVPRSPICLLSPQHWGQQANDEFPNKRGTWVGDYPDCCILYWNQSKFQQTVKYDPRLNVA